MAKVTMITRRSLLATVPAYGTLTLIAPRVIAASMKLLDGGRRIPALAVVSGVNYCAVCLRYQCCVASREAPKTPRISLISFSIEINGGQNANASPMTRLIIPRSWA